MRRIVGAILGVLSLLFASCAAPTIDVTPAPGLYQIDGPWNSAGGQDRMGLSLQLGYRKIVLELVYDESAERVVADLKQDRTDFGLGLSL